MLLKYLLSFIQIGSSSDERIYIIIGASCCAFIVIVVFIILGLIYHKYVRRDYAVDQPEEGE